MNYSKSLAPVMTYSPTLSEATAEFDSHDAFSLVETISMVIDSMDAEQSATVNQTRDTWKFRYGTVEVLVNITGASPTDTFTVVSTVAEGPFKDEATLMKKLLEKNMAETFEARFAMQDGKIFLVSSRSVEDLSPAEISRIIAIVAAIADDNDEPLKAEFCA